MIDFRNACNNLAFQVPLVPRVACLTIGDLIDPWMLNAARIEILHRYGSYVRQKRVTRSEMIITNTDGYLCQQ